MSAVEFESHISDELGIQLGSTLIFDYPSVASMAQHICSQLGVTEAKAALQLQNLNGIGTAATLDQEGRLLVEISIAGRLPRGCMDGCNGGSDGITKVPFDRWDLEQSKVGFRSCVCAMNTLTGWVPWLLLLVPADLCSSSLDA